MVVESTCGGIGADFDLEIEFEGELRFLAEMVCFIRTLKLFQA